MQQTRDQIKLTQNVTELQDELGSNYIGFNTKRFY